MRTFGRGGGWDDTEANSILVDAEGGISENPSTGQHVPQCEIPMIRGNRKRTCRPGVDVVGKHAFWQPPSQRPQVSWPEWLLIIRSCWRRRLQEGMGEMFLAGIVACMHLRGPAEVCRFAAGW